MDTKWWFIVENKISSDKNASNQNWNSSKQKMFVDEHRKLRGNDNGGKIIEKIGLYRNSILWIQAAHFMPSCVAVAEFLLKANVFICCGHI